MGDEAALFVMDKHGNFYDSPNYRGKYHHSSPIRGEPAAGAGEWIVRNGKVSILSVKSHHYEPEEPSLPYSELRNQGAADWDYIEYYDFMDR
jgi:hypothetical protein